MRTIWVLLLCACATINTAGMSEACKSAYNACLSACREAPRQGEARLNPPQSTRVDPGIAACTADCDQRSQKCQ